MKRWLLLVLAVNLLAVVALTFAYPHLMVSPGVLTQGHAELAADCFACHQPLQGASSQRCIGCHALPDVGLRTTRGAPLARQTTKTAFHQDLIEQDCMACHSDHEGPRVGKRSRKAFSHALLRPAVREVCESCHKAPTDTLHRQIKGNCKQCHTPDRWKPAAFDHDKFFLLDRDHSTECVTCHTGSDFSRYTCYGCHEHRPDKVRKEHLEVGIRDFEKCVECHRNATDEPRRAGAGEDGRKRQGSEDRKERNRD